MNQLDFHWLVALQIFFYADPRPYFQAIFSVLVNDRREITKTLGFCHISFEK